MNNTFGFIGTGNMGGALARAAARAMAPEAVFLSDREEDRAQAVLLLSASVLPTLIPLLLTFFLNAF